MIYEYALEPELVASWHERLLFRLFIEEFGLGTGRMVSRYPKKWRKLVWKAFNAAFAATTGDIEHTRITELLMRLCEPQVSRLGSVWDDTLIWIENAEKENERCPFHAILSRNNPQSQPNVLLIDDIIDDPPETWFVPASKVVPRTAGSMAAAIRPMLRCAKQIVFVDPHFRAGQPKYKNPFRAFFRLICSKSDVTIELHAGHVSDNAPNWETFKQECEQHLPALVPLGLNLIVLRWKNRDNSERLHNRYVLTNIGGVQFSVGLDEGGPQTTDDVTRLDTDSYRQRMEDYTGASPAFDLEGKVKIIGIRDN